MPHQPDDREPMEQTNADNAKGWQTQVRAETSYVGEIHIHQTPLVATPTQVEAFRLPLHNIPPSNTTQFVGREAELVKLHQLLQQSNIVAITDTTGAGGVGKTELAVQYCMRHLSDYPSGICWLYPKTADIGTQIVEFSKVQFLKVPIPDGLSLSSQVSFCWRQWHTGVSLLVIDNVTTAEFEQLKAYLPLNVAQFKVLLTTRDRLRALQQLPLGVLKRPDALNLLGALIGQEWLQQEADFAEKLCAKVGDSPLALHVIAGLIEREVVPC